MVCAEFVLFLMKAHRRVIDKQNWRHVCRAHEREANALDAVVNVLLTLVVTKLEKGRWVDIFVFTQEKPGVLSNYILP